MVVRRSTHEARIADLKEAHEANRRDLMKLVDMLAEQIDYMRQLAGRPNFARTVPLNPSKQPPVEQGGWAHVSEEEEDLRALQEFGHISQFEMDRLAEELNLHLKLDSVS